jgi:hypothetical protein
MNQWLLFGFLCLSIPLVIFLKKMFSQHIFRKHHRSAVSIKGLNTSEQNFLIRLQQALPHESILIQGKRFLIQSPTQHTQIIFIFRSEQPVGRDYRQEQGITVVIYKSSGSVDEILADWQKYRKFHSMDD